MALAETELGTASLAPVMTGHADLVCHHTDSLFFAVRRCLDSGTGVCLVLDDGRRLIGRVTLESIRCAIRAGELMTHTQLGDSIALLPEPIRTDAGGLATPVLDSSGCLVDVVVDSGHAPVPLAKPDMSFQELEVLLDAFLSNWISSRGPYVTALEQGFARFAATAHGVAVSSGTSALHVALLALGIGPGDEVIVPDLTFAATINAVLHCGATPVIADIDADNWGLCPKSLARGVTPRTAVVIPVHLYGRPVLSETIACARQHGLAVIEDCAEAQGALLGGRRVGSVGDIGCFSLFANKLITTGEGGMCTTDCEGFALAMRELRDHGVRTGMPYWHDRVGYNYRMTNLQASIGTVQLKRFEEIVKKRDRIARLYLEHLSAIPGVKFPPPCEEGSKPVNWLVTVTVPPGRRDAIVEAARDAGIELRGFFHSLSAMPPYHAYARECPNSAALSERGLCLPTSGNIDTHVVERIAQIMREVLAG